MLKSSEKKIGQSATLQNIFRPAGAFPSALVHANVVAGAYATEVLADNPVGYWTLDDTSGTTCVDSSPSARDMTYSGSPTLGATPLISVRNAVAFASASSQRAARSGNSADAANSRITVEAWIKTSQAGSTTNPPEIFAATDSATSNRYFQFRQSASGSHNTLEFIVFDSGDTAHTWTGSVVINDNAVHHVVGTYDGTKLHGYIDGTEDGTGTSASFTVATGNPSQTCIACAFSFGSYVNFWNGTLDEVALYTSALSSTRILAHYNAR